MTTNHACADGWVCEAHPDREWPHDDCAGPGMPCELCNLDEERKPAYDVAFASTNEPVASVKARNAS